MATTFPQFSYSPAKIRRVKHMQFGVLSPTELKAMSVAHITKADLMVNGVAVPGGLEDPKLGTCDYHATCRTCRCTYTGSGQVNDCPGHFGHIELAKPVFHIGFLGVVHSLLRCVCINCSRVLMDKNDAAVKEALRQRNPKKRLHALLKIGQTKRVCASTKAPELEGVQLTDAPVEGRQGCGCAQPRYRREGFNLSIEFDDNQDVEGARKRPLLAEEVYNIFKGISDEDCRLLGLNPVFARPDWLLCTVLPVPPPHVRPPVALDNMSRSQDDLTYKLADIIKANTGLKNALNKGEPATIVDEYEKLLQYHIATFVDNQLPGQPQAKQRGGKKVLKTIRQRLVGKGGRVRQNLMGKRVDFSARTVITADPNLSIDRVGVPRSIAANLTIPERVTRYNLARLQRLVANGPSMHPGAKFIIHEDGNRIDLRFVSNRSDLNLRQGWTVERHLADGDYVLFNRQPSLHKMSIMCHRVKVMDYSTFRLNLTCTSPYNADFDGDEMNLHALQTLPAIAEAKELMVTPRLIVSAQSNKPVMGIVQDTLLGAQKMTKRDILIEKWKMMNMVMWMGDVWDGKLPAPAIMVRKRSRVPGGKAKMKPYWTGKQLFSMIVPDVSLTLNSSGAPDEPFTAEELHPKDTKVIIDRGELLAGIIDKKTLGKSAGGLVHVIMNDAAPEDARDFLNNVQRVVNYWLHNRGFSIGIADAEADAETMRVIANTIKDAKIQVADLVQKGQMGELKTQPGNTMVQSFENMVNMALNQAREQAGKRAAQALDETNAVRAMVSAGSKGSFINIAQIIACVGQQNVEGKRIPCRFEDRSLPHYAKDDLGPQSRGFVENSYLKGLTPQEFYFHMMGGREGLIDTAVKTAETGYIQRRLVKAMEDVSVRYDGTVRNSEGIVIQFLYGEDGMDGRWVEFQKFDTFNYNAGKFRAKFEFNPDSPNFGRMPSRSGLLYMDPGIIEHVRTSSEVRALLDDEIRQLRDDRVLLCKILTANKLIDKRKAALPVNLHRLVANARKKFKTDNNKPSDLDPSYVIEEIRKLLTGLVVVAGDDVLSVEAQENATTLFSIHVRATLASKRVIKEYRLSRSAFDWTLGEVRRCFMNAMVAPGEMSGVLAAQSMGEPATQMTLNTFHYAGVSAKNVTLGVPRLKELINVARRINTPSLLIYLKPHLASDEGLTKAMMREFEYTALKDMTDTAEIYYDPDPENCVIEQDREWLLPALMLEEMGDDEVVSPWLLRLELGNKKRQFSFAHIKQCILSQLKDSSLQVLFNDDNSDQPVLHLRMKYTKAEKAAADVFEMESGETQDAVLKELSNTLLANLKLGGVDDIKKVYFKNDRQTVWSQERGCEQLSEWTITTDGTNLLEILSHPDVDATRTASNDIVEILSVLGIEAARSALLFELRAVVEFDGSYVNYRHLGTLVDVMTARGYLTAITRHGINRVDNGPLQRASFEETCEIYMDAAAFAEDDGLNGVTENLMLGQLCPMGTGTFDLVLDADLLKGALEFQDVVPTGAEAAQDPSAATPMQMASPGMVSPMDSGAMTPDDGAAFSPGGSFTPSPLSPGALSPMSGAYSSDGSDGGSDAPGWFPDSPALHGSGYASPAYGGQSPGYAGAGDSYSPASPGYSPTSPGYSPASPGYSPTSPGYSPTSPGYSPTSPGYSPTSPGYSPTSPGYSPTSPGYSPTSPGYSPTSPGYSPTSPGYSPTSPGYSPTSPGYSPTSPGYSPTSPGYSPSSPAVSPSAGYSPTSPGVSPSSPGYSPSSPAYNSTSPSLSPSYSPSASQYSGSATNYSMSQDNGGSPSVSPTPGSGSSGVGSGVSGNYSPQEQ